MGASRRGTYQQYRRITAGGGDSVDAVHDGFGGSTDMDIRISASSDGATEYEAALYNLTDSTWRDVSQGDPCRISLGWDGGKINHVLFGTVEIKRREPDGRDTRHILKGVDETERQTKARISKTWRDKSPSQIVNSLARELSLTAGNIDPVEQPIEGNYGIKNDEPVSYWLDELTSEAEKRTDTQWEWFAQAGRLYFERKDSDTEQATILSYDNTLLDIGAATGHSDASDEDVEELEFTALMEPDIRKGRLVGVDTERFSGVYKVTEYQFRSNSTTGDHQVTGTITPVDSQYEWSRLSTGGSSGGITWAGRDSGTAG